MEFAPGERLMHYEIVHRLGGGRIVDVYRARDLQLEREVVLKFLSETLARNPRSVARFTARAKALAALNHPDFAAIYGVEERDGLHFVVMEFVEGEPISELIPATGLELQPFSRWAMALAQAMSFAHKSGLTHGALELADIFLDKYGHLKIIGFDFLRHGKEGVGEGGSFPGGPEPLEMTQALHELQGVGPDGMVAALASMPEGVRGKPLEPEADISSLGGILYEMVTGRPPCSAKESNRSTLSILVKRLGRSKDGGAPLPRGLERIFRGCLTKSPKARFQSMEELSGALELFQRELFSSEGNFSENGVVRRRLPPGRSIAAAIVAVGILVIAGCVLWCWTEESDPSRNMKPVVTWPGREWNCHVSPDARWISFISESDGGEGVWLCPVGGGEFRQVFARDQASLLGHLWSPDGNRLLILFKRFGKKVLEIVPAFGGTRGREVISEKLDLQGMVLVRWAKGGIYLERSGQGLFRYQLDSGRLRLVLPSSDSEGERVDFDVRPDEKELAYCTFEGGRSILWVSGMDGARPRKLTNDGASDFHPRWRRGRKWELLFSSNRGGQYDLWSVKTERGVPIRLASGAGIEKAGVVSSDGSLVAFQRVVERADIYLFDPATDRGHLLTGNTLQELWPSCSRRNRLVAFQRGGVVRSHLMVYGANIFLGRLDGHGLQDTRPVVVKGGRPSLSSEGRFLAFVQKGAESLELWNLDLATERRWRLTERFVPHGLEKPILAWSRQNMAWSSSREEFYFVSETKGGGQEIQRLDCDKKKRPERLLEVPKGKAVGDLLPSSDGRRLAYVRSAEIDGSEVLCVRDLGSGLETPLWRFKGAPGTAAYWPGWLEDGAGLIALRGREAHGGGGRLEVLRIGLDGEVNGLGEIAHGFGATARLVPGAESLILVGAERAGGPRNLYEFRLSDGTLQRLTENSIAGISFSGIEVLPDGRFLYSRQETRGDIFGIWFHD